MAGDLALNILIRATNLTGGAMGQVVSSLRSVNSIVGIAAVAAAAIGAAVIGVGIKSVQMASQYQQAMNMVQALTGSSAQQMQQYDASLKALAIDAGVAPTELAKGLYNVLSAGLPAAEAMNVLTLATEDAKIGMTDAATTSKALIAVLSNFHVKAKDVTAANGEMLQTVTLGMMTFGDYASSIGKASIAAAANHVTMEQMNATIATLTAHTVPARQAVTDFVQVLQLMGPHLDTLVKSLEKGGIAFDKTKFYAMDYSQKVQYLAQKLQEASDKHIKLSGTQQNAVQLLRILSQNQAQYNQDLAKLSDRQSMAQATAQKWAITQSGFSQQMSRAKAALDVLFITIGQQLLPVLTQLAARVTPIISQFVTWLVKSNALSNGIAAVRGFLAQMGQTIASVMSVAIPIFQRIIAVISQVFQWFMQNKVVMEAFKITAIALGIALGVILVVALAAVAVAIGAVVLAVMILMSPLIVIILLVRNWGAIMHWLQGVMSTVINAIKSVVAAGFQAILNFIMTPIHEIVAGFEWLYAHNYYFQRLVDFIRNVTSAGLAWLRGAWQAAMSFLAGVWSNIVSQAQSLWDHIVSFFSGAWGRISGPLSSLGSNIGSFFSNLASQAFQWGANVIQGIVNGINSMLGAVGNAAGNVAHTVMSFLGFHSPTEKGPGRDADKWMPNFIHMLAYGLNAGVPTIHRATLNLASPLAQLSGGSFGLSGTRGSVFALSGSNGNAFALGTGGQTIVIQVQPAKADINLDRRKVGEGIMQYAQKEVRIQGTVRNR